MPSEQIIAVTAGVNPVTGVETIGIKYRDGSIVTQPGPWSEARELADAAGLDHMEPLPGGATRWSRRSPA